MEKEIVNQALVRVSQIGSRLFRNNTGTGWQGSKVIKMDGESLMIKNPRPLRAGLVTGSSDCLGWTPVTITPEMVGKKIAVFTALEGKDLKGRVSEEQKNFIANVEEAGGITGVFRSADEAVAIIENWKKNNGLL